MVLIQQVAHGIGAAHSGTQKGLSGAAYFAAAAQQAQHSELRQNLRVQQQHRRQEVGVEVPEKEVPVDRRCDLLLKYQQLLKSPACFK